MRSSAWLRGTFPEHLDALRQRFGDEAAEVRHELFFLQTGRSPMVAGLRALAALLRDAWLLLWHTGPTPEPQNRPQAILLTTLAGSSGWGTLQRALPTLTAAGYEPVLLPHPRLTSADLAPGLRKLQAARVGPLAWLAALRMFIHTLGQRRSLLLACCLTRRSLWTSSLRRTLAASRGVLVLHNDFDLMSRAAIGHGLPSVCLQHGVPTDEFFPISADRYLVWGASSRQAFEANGSLPSRLIEDALDRGTLPAAPLLAPQDITLLSQTHAPVLGEGIGEALRAFADALLHAAPTARILLHPFEDQPYTGAAARATRRAPHAELQGSTAEPRLLVGYCSTAMLDAALAGHWVVALHLPLAGNLAARQVLAAPLRAETAAQVVSLYQRLRDDPPFRHEQAQAQAQWLAAQFSSDGDGLAGLLQQLKPSAALEQAR